MWRIAQLKKYGESRTFCKSKSPLFGNGGKANPGYVVWKPSSNCQQITTNQSFIMRRLKKTQPMAFVLSTLEL